MKQDSIFGDLYFQVTWKGKYEYVLTTHTDKKHCKEGKKE